MVIRRALQAGEGAPTTTQSRHAIALEERLRDDDGYETLEDRPFEETIDRLCVDLCLSPDWWRWAREGRLEDGTPWRSRYSEFSAPSRKCRPADCG